MPENPYGDPIDPESTSTELPDTVEDPYTDPPARPDAPDGIPEPEPDEQGVDAGLEAAAPVPEGMSTGGADRSLTEDRASRVPEPDAETS